MVPISIPSRSAGITGIPFTISMAVSIPTSPATAPTDRSIPAIRMAKNSPRASRIFTALCFSIWGILSGLKMLDGFAMVSTASKSRNIPMVPYFCHSTPKLGLVFTSV